MSVVQFSRIMFRHIIVPVAITIAILTLAVGSVPTANVVVFISPGGFSSTVSDILTPALHWRAALQSKTMPFNVTLEFINVNPINTFDLTTAVKIAQPIIQARLTNLSLPRATVILGPDFAVGKKAGGLIPTYLTYKAPHVLPYSYPDATLTVQPASIGGGSKGLSFYTLGSVALINKPLIYEYARQGVKTIAAVVLQDYAATFNKDTCGSTLKLATALGMTIVYNATMPNADSAGVLYDGLSLQGMVNQQIDLVRAAKPDLLLWCDNQGCTNPDLIPYIMPLPLMKAKNYLPKALSVLSCVDNSRMAPMKQAGLMDFVVGPTLISPKLKGTDFTEGEQPYGNLFRPHSPVPFTTINQVTQGSVADSPSSVQMYYEWYLAKRNSTNPMTMTTGAIGSIAAIDMIESALYRTAIAMKARGVGGGVMSGSEVRLLL